MAFAVVGPFFYVFQQHTVTADAMETYILVNWHYFRRGTPFRARLVMEGIPSSTKFRVLVKLGMFYMEISL